MFMKQNNLESGLGTKVIDVPYYLRDNSLLSSYNEDYSNNRMLWGVKKSKTRYIVKLVTQSG